MKEPQQLSLQFFVLYLNCVLFFFGFSMFPMQLGNRSQVSGPELGAWWGSCYILVSWLHRSSWQSLTLPHATDYEVWRTDSLSSDVKMWEAQSQNSECPFSLETQHQLPEERCLLFVSSIGPSFWLTQMSLINLSGGSRSSGFNLVDPITVDLPMESSNIPPQMGCLCHTDHDPASPSAEMTDIAASRTTMTLKFLSPGHFKGFLLEMWWR